MGEAAQKLEDDPSTKQEVLEAFKSFEHFCKTMLDAYVLVDAEGHVLKANQLFSQLTGCKLKLALKEEETFDHLLSLYINGEQIFTKNLLSHDTPTRLDEVRGKNHVRDDLNLIIGIYPFFGEQKTRVGAFILIRDVTAETNLQGKYKAKATQSITDPLTGLYNRAYFEKYLAAQARILAENMLPDSCHRNLSVVMFDIDHFKKVNDVYGHQAGDYVLKTVAELISSTFRKTDVVCRYGGEEFLAILPATEVNGAIQAADKLRKLVADAKFSYASKNIPVTISCGVAQLRIGKETPEETISRADSALYFSKETGRNRVSVNDGVSRNYP